MEYIVKGLFINSKKKNRNNIKEMLNFEKGDDAFYEAKLKFCNFYLLYSEENCDRTEINDIFDD